MHAHLAGALESGVIFGADGGAIAHDYIPLAEYPDEEVMELAEQVAQYKIADKL